MIQLTEEQIRAEAEEAAKKRFNNPYWRRSQQSDFVKGYIAAASKYLPQTGGFLSVLYENMEAMKRLSETDKDFPHKNILLETYEDLIEIYKNGSWKTGEGWISVEEIRAIRKKIKDSKFEKALNDTQEGFNFALDSIDSELAFAIGDVVTLTPDDFKSDQQKK